MKKTLFLLLLLIPINTFAYENDYFSIDVDESYQITENDNIYTFNNDNSHIEISILNNEKKECICNYNSKDIKNYKDEIINSLNDNTTENNFEYKISSITKVKINNIEALNYNISWYTKDVYGYDVFSQNYVFTTSNYITNITYTSPDNDSIIDIIKTLEIKDEVLNFSIFNNIANVIIFLLLILGSTSIICLLKGKKLFNKTTLNKFKCFRFTSRNL